MAIPSSELLLASWVLSAFTIPVGDEGYAAQLLREFSWQQFRGRNAALLWKAMAELQADGLRPELDFVVRHLGRDLEEIGDESTLWDLIRIEHLPSTPILTELLLPALRTEIRKRRRWFWAGGAA